MVFLKPKEKENKNDNEKEKESEKEKEKAIPYGQGTPPLFLPGFYF